MSIRICNTPIRIGRETRTLREWATLKRVNYSTVRTRYLSGERDPEKLYAATNYRSLLYTLQTHYPGAALQLKQLSLRSEPFQSPEDIVLQLINTEYERKITSNKYRSLRTTLKSLREELDSDPDTEHLQPEDLHPDQHVDEPAPLPEPPALHTLTASEAAREELFRRLK